MKNYLNQLINFKSKIYQTTIIGLILISVGLIFFNALHSFHLKVSLSMILLGFLCIYLLSIKKAETPRTITGVHLLIIISLWIFLLFIFIRDIDTDIFFIIVIIGILVIKEFMNHFIDPQIKKRMDALFNTLIIIFAVIVGQRVINIIGI